MKGVKEKGINISKIHPQKVVVYNFWSSNIQIRNKIYFLSNTGRNFLVQVESSIKIGGALRELSKLMSIKKTALRFVMIDVKWHGSPLTNQNYVWIPIKRSKIQFRPG